MKYFLNEEDKIQKMDAEINKDDLFYKKTSLKDYEMDLNQHDFQLYLRDKDESISFIQEIITKYWLDVLNKKYNIKVSLTEDTLKSYIEKVFSTSSINRSNFCEFLKEYGFEDYEIEIALFDEDLRYFLILKVNDQYLITPMIRNGMLTRSLLLISKLKSILVNENYHIENFEKYYSIYEAALYEILTFSPGEQNFYKSELKDLLKLFSTMDHLKKNKESYFIRLRFLLDKEGFDNKQHIFNVFKRDLKIDANFSPLFKNFQDGFVIELIQEVIFKDVLKEFEVPLTDVELTYLYNFLFNIAYDKNQFALSIQIATFLVENDRIRNNYKQILKTLPFKDYPSDYPAFIKPYQNFFEKFYWRLLDCYIKEKKFKSAYDLLKSSALVTTPDLYLYFTGELEIDVHGKSSAFEELFEYSLLQDISLIIRDVFYNPNIKDSILKKWFERSKDKDFFDKYLNPTQVQLSNIILVAITNEDDYLAQYLIGMMQKYFINSYNQLDELIFFMNAYKSDSYEFEKNILRLLQNASSSLKRIEELDNSRINNLNEEITQITRMYSNAGTIINNQLRKKKLDIFSDILQRHLDEDIYNSIIDNVIQEMHDELDLKELDKEIFDSYEKLFASEEYLGLVWQFLDEYSQKCLVFGMYLYDMQRKLPIDYRTDFSSTIINWSLSLEHELKKRFFEPFSNFCKSKYNYELDFKNKNSKKKDLNFTLGSFYWWVRSDVGTANARVKKYFLEFCEKVYPTLSIKEIEQTFNEVGIQIGDILKLRNKSAHPESLAEHDVITISDLLFPTKNVLIRILKNYQN